MALILTFLPSYNPSNVLLSKNLSNFQRPFQVNSLSGGVRHYEASTNKWIHLLVLVLISDNQIKSIGILSDYLVEAFRIELKKQKQTCC